MKSILLALLCAASCEAMNFGRRIDLGPSSLTELAIVVEAAHMAAGNIVVVGQEDQKKARYQKMKRQSRQAMIVPKNQKRPPQKPNHRLNYR